MIIEVIKRDGTIVPFDKKKIKNAIMAAMEKTDNIKPKTANRIASEISKLNYETITVEEIQDLVEIKLMDSSLKSTAKEYILYREKRTNERNKNSKLHKQIHEKLTASNVQNQNANVDEHSFGGRRGEAAAVYFKQDALNNIISPMARENHLNNMIYIHDLDAYSVGMHNCLSLPIDDLLAKGFNTRQTDIRPANSINTAFQLLAVLFQLQSLQQFGGVSATHLDWSMVPYVRKSFYKHFKNGLIYISQWNESSAEGFRLRAEEEERGINDIEFFRQIGIHYQTYDYAMDMTEKELKQAVEGMYHNLKY